MVIFAEAADVAVASPHWRWLLMLLRSSWRLLLS
jgi:hypothetical protein